MIFDPKDELFVASPTFSGLPNGASIQCSSVGVTRQFCTFTWSPNFTSAEGAYTITGIVTGKNQDSQDTASKDYTFKLDLNVLSSPPINLLTQKGGH